MKIYLSREPGAEIRVFDPVALMAQIENDTDLLHELISCFSTECPRMLAELEQLLTDGNSAGVRRVSHALKGSFLQLSATNLATMATELEEKGRTSNLNGATEVFSTMKEESSRLLNALSSFSEEKH